MSYTAAPTRYDTMKYRRCGDSGLFLPVISLGMWHNFGYGRPYEQAEAIVRTAFDNGITHFDLANNYGPPPGSAEATFGKILRDAIGVYRDEIVISTKAGYRMQPGPYGEWGSRKYLISSLDASLKRMGIDYVDIFYSHRFDPGTPLEETMGALASAVHSGKALYAGISSYDAENTLKAAEILRSMGVRCLIHQPSYSMMNRAPETTGVIGAIHDSGMGMIAFCPLAQGLLTSRYLSGIPSDSRIAHGELGRDRLTENVLAGLRRLDRIASGRGQTLAQMSLTWVLRDDRVTSALIGASRPEQVLENIAAANAEPLSPEELAEIDGILAGM